jgi:hypothetical protein
MLRKKENPKRDGIVTKQLNNSPLFLPRTLLAETLFRLLLHLFESNIFAIKVTTIRFHLEYHNMSALTGFTL